MFIDETQFRQRAQESTPLDTYHDSPTWMEGFAASIGQMFDEGSSISGLLNNEGYRERNIQIEESGLDLSPYTNYKGDIDYDAINAFMPEIKTDEMIEQARSEDLARNREYAQRVLSETHWSAELLGTGVAAMLDPISVATLPLAIPVTAAKSLSILSRAAHTAKSVAIVEAGTEAAIQPFIFQHKSRIDSPYAASDAITAIGAAAAFGGALGFGGGAISGYIRKTLNNTNFEKLDAVGKRAYMEAKAMEDTLKDIPADQQEAVLNDMVDIDSGVNKYTEPDIDAPEIPAQPRGSKLNERLGEYQADMDVAQAEFDQLDLKMVPDDEGRLVDGDEYMAEIDSELNGLENIARCVYG